MRSVASAARAASSTASGAGVPGWPTSRWMTECPWASRTLAARSTSIAMNGGTRPRREGPRGIAALGTDVGRGAARRLDDPPGRSRVAHQPVGRADRAPHQIAATIRTASGQHALGAVAAERALIRADPRLFRVRRQVAVAALAVRTQFKHRPRPAPPDQSLRPTWLPAVVPAILPNTDPDTSPVPPG